MKKVKILLLLSLFSLVLIANCNHAHKEKVHPESKTKNLIIKENLTKTEQAELTLLEEKFNEIAKHFAYQEHYINKLMVITECPKLVDMYKYLDEKPISLESLRLSGRISYFASNVCDSFDEQIKDTSVLSKQDRLFILTKISNSALLLVSLGNIERYEEKNETKAKRYFTEALKVDQNDLISYPSILASDVESLFNNETKNSLQKEYCRKAVELKQWDHVYYLTNEKDIENNDCPEAMKLVAPHYSKDYIYRNWE